MLKSALALLLVLLGTLAQAQSLEVMLLDNQGQPLSDAVLWIEPGPAQSQPATAVMDQQQRQFTPYVLPVQVGTTVSFPNSDPINHHVYSFSPAKRFELRLHQQKAAPQEMRFDQPGLVTLGCNIHDWMLGFILVLDTPWFAQTDKQGKASLQFDAAAGQTLQLWHPRIADPQEALSRAVPSDGTLTWQLTGALKRDPRPQEPKTRPTAKRDYAS
ncbi:methylamine utilization protein [Pseudomonas anguilliseptica]|uniref:methylamine utilization protein n=1 Tax=Pseudomonas anguilliseptica TaxID=53406 RepID=UPI001F40C8BF|nr:methylamine utilization protein [Pseudomonas anguilliseptica]MCE5361851.1 methylamine utilization protein [Pseudomonas anguilliseptica]